MHEGDLHVMGAGARRFVDHAQPRLLQLGDASLDVVHRERQVMQSLAPLLQKLSHGTLRIGGLQQLQPHVFDAKKTDAYFLVGNFLLTLSDVERIGGA